jgi:16S rRNA (guanine966-N2)-methyltransferase
MRITAGVMRGRTLRVPDIEGLRPTPSRAREALFNILGSVQGFSVLDLFAGSGIMGLEALSRGAKHVVSMEEHAEACKAMNRIQQGWSLDAWQIKQGALPHILPSASHFDFIYADPPYGKGLAEQVPVWLSKQGVSYDILVIEEASRSRLRWKPAFMPNKSRKYSETTLYFFQPDIEVGI